MHLVHWLNTVLRTEKKEKKNAIMLLILMKEFENYSKKCDHLSLPIL